jgi:hypothetical protein
VVEFVLNANIRRSLLRTRLENCRKTLLQETSVTEKANNRLYLVLYSLIYQF